VGEAAQSERSQGGGSGGRQQGSKVDLAHEERQQKRKRPATHQPVESGRARSAPLEETRGEDRARSEEEVGRHGRAEAGGGEVQLRWCLTILGSTPTRFNELIMVKLLFTYFIWSQTTLKKLL